MKAELKHHLYEFENRALLPPVLPLAQTQGRQELLYPCLTLSTMWIKILKNPKAQELPEHPLHILQAQALFAH